MQCALIKTMTQFKKGGNVAWATTETPIIGLMNATEDSSRKDRKSPIDVMKVLTTAF